MNRPERHRALSPESGKAEVFARQMEPLLEQLHQLCVAHQIPYLQVFQMDHTPEHGEFLVHPYFPPGSCHKLIDMLAIMDPERASDYHMKQAFEELMRGFKFMPEPD